MKCQPSGKGRMWLAGRCETLEEAGMISIQTMPASSRSGIEIMRLTFVEADICKG